MMPDKNGCIFILHCDICGDPADEEFYDFQTAVDYKKSNGWKSQRHNGEWEDICPECAEGSGSRW